MVKDEGFIPVKTGEVDKTQTVFNSVRKEHPWNVITEEDFKVRMNAIFTMIYTALKHTAGPYGGGTLIEKLGDYHLSKDGFTVLKHIHFDNTTDNNIMDLILNISNTMVSKVGDGSTTAILAAKAFLDYLRADESLSKLRPKEFNEKIQEIVEELVKIIQAESIPVTQENYVDVVEKVAKVATNDNQQYSRFIKEIYEKNGMDVSIAKKLSATNTASYELRNDMFYINGKFLDKIYVNNDNGTVELENPVVLLFNFTLEDKHWNMIRLFMQHLNEMYPENRVLVIAPYYDALFAEHIKADVIAFRQEWAKRNKGIIAGAVPYPLVFGSAPFIRSVDHYIFDDLTGFLGNSVINNVTADEFLNAIHEYSRAMQEIQQNELAYQNAVMMAQQQGRDPNEIKKFDIDTSKADDLYKKSMELFSSFIGICDKVVMDMKTIQFSGFSHSDDAMVKLHIDDAKAMLDKEYEQVENARYVGKEYMYAKERLSRLACRSAVIEVGGNTPLEKTLNLDALDDAIRACESTVRYGYYWGNNLAIFNAIDKLCDKIYNDETNNKTPDDDVLKLKILGLIMESFTDVIQTIYQNKDEKCYTRQRVKYILNEAQRRQQCYDLTKDEYTDDIINSSQTDVEILRGAISIIGTIMSANQYIATYISVDKVKAEQ